MDIVSDPKLGIGYVQNKIDGNIIVQYNGFQYWYWVRFPNDNIALSKITKIGQVKRFKNV